MANSGQRLRDALKHLRQHRAPTTLCPTEEALVGYAERFLPVLDKDAMEEHLAACDVCLDAVLLQREPLAKATDASVRKRLGHPVGRLVSRLNLVDLAVRWIRGAMEVEESTASLGWQYAYAGTTLRSGAIREHQRVEFTKVVGPVSLAVQLAHDADGYNVVVTPQEAANDAVRPLRVALFSADRELDSVPVGSDPIVYEGLAPGLYRWVVDGNGQPVGAFSIDLGEEERDG